MVPAIASKPPDESDKFRWCCRIKSGSQRCTSSPVPSPIAPRSAGLLPFLHTRSNLHISPHQIDRQVQQKDGQSAERQDHVKKIKMIESKASYNCASFWFPCARHGI
ncbi:hypothetical protein FCV25MIE_26047 [Fagus crenata]